jgi:hypothetical protein
MGVPFLIIDGYNLLHGANLARETYGPGELQRRRERLLGMLCEKLSPAEQMRCTVVFDAQSVPGDAAREQRHQELLVIFAAASSDADTQIEELLAKHPAAKQTIVVSSDHRLHKAAKRRGARPIDSEPFWERLQQRPDARTTLVEEPGPAPKSRRPPSVTAKETEWWLREFGEISVASLAEEVRAEEQNHPGGSPWERHLAELDQALQDDAALDDFLYPRRRRSDTK